MIDISNLIHAIERRQPVLNKDGLDVAIGIDGVASLKLATQRQVAFIAQAKYLDELSHTNAGVVLISQKFADDAQACLSPNTTPIIVKDAYLAYACISTLFAPQTTPAIHPTAVIAPSAQLGEQVSIGAYAVIGERAQVADGVVIGSHCVIGDDVSIGKDSVLEPHVSIAHDCHLGECVRVHSHASIGSEGFGFAPMMGANGVEWQRIAQLGRVMIGNHVRIGSNTCIDRGAVDDTVIGDHVIIDNLVQIAHNVRIGSGTAMAAKVAIAGSTTIGKNCIIGGATGIAGHLSIADGVTITAMTMVISDISESGTYSSGTVAMPQAKWRRAAVRFRQLGEK